MADAVIEEIGTVPAGRGGIAMFPGIHSQVTVAIVKQAGQSVAHLVTHLVPGLSLAVELLASSQVLFKVNIAIVAVGGLVRGNIHPTRRSHIKNFAVLTTVALCTATGIIAWPINALAIVLAAVVHALVSVIRLTVGACCAAHTLAPITGAGSNTGAPVVTGHVLTAVSL